MTLGLKYLNLIIKDPMIFKIINVYYLTTLIHYSNLNDTLL
jgi:hypothetical protein